jgi:hypothetical protein
VNMHGDPAAARPAFIRRLRCVTGAWVFLHTFVGVWSSFGGFGKLFFGIFNLGFIFFWYPYRFNKAM